MFMVYGERVVVVVMFCCQKVAYSADGCLWVAVKELWRSFAVRKLRTNRTESKAHFQHWLRACPSSSKVPRSGELQTQKLKSHIL